MTPAPISVERFDKYQLMRQEVSPCAEFVPAEAYDALLHQLAEAERAREGATGLLREVEPEINELSNIYYSEFSNTKREKETEALHSRIAAFLAASGGA